MFIAIAIFGLLIAGIGLWGFVFPSSFMTQVLRLSRTPKGLYWVVGWRLVLGFLLVIAAPLSPYSTFFYVIGVLSLFGALLTIIMGPRYVERYLEWLQLRPAICLRGIMMMGWLLGVMLTFMAARSL